MSLKIGSDNIGDVYVGSDKISKIYVGSDLVYSAVTNDLRFNYIGIDANGYDESNDNYNGNPVKYAIGKYRYEYSRYTIVTPTPTEASAYADKYVYDTSTSAYTICSYDSSTSTLTPDWVVVGTTVCYTRSFETYDTKQTETSTFKIYSVNTAYNGAFNKEYWGNDIDAGYDDSSDIPVIPELYTLILPDVYQGKPVTDIKKASFYGRSLATTGAKWHTAYQIKNITLGENITNIELNGFFMVCRIPEGNDRSFTFNNKLETLAQGSLGGVFSSGASYGSVTLPNSVTTINAETFGPVYGSSYKFPLNKLTIASPIISCTASLSYGIVDHCNYVIFENTVTSISGTLKYTANSPSGVIVFKHSQNQSITLSISKNKSAIACTIYTDCDAVKNYDWASKNYTVTFKPLSEYTGG